MTTVAEAVKTVLQAYDWTITDYGTEPAIAILGIDNLNGIPPDKYITLEDVRENPVYTVNGVRLEAPSTCNLELSEVTSALRATLMDAVEEIFQDDHGIILEDIVPDNKNNLFKYKMKITKFI